MEKPAEKLPPLPVPEGEGLFSGPNHAKAKEMDPLPPGEGREGPGPSDTWSGPMGVVGALPSCPTLPPPASSYHEPMSRFFLKSLPSCSVYLRVR